MYIKLDIYFIGISTGVFILLFLSIILFLSKNGNRKANRFLALYLVTISYAIFGLGFFISGRVYFHLPHLILTAVPCLCILGPSVFLYVQELLNPEKNKGFRKYLHFIPFLLLVIYFIPFFIKDSNYKINFIINWIAIGKYSENFIRLYFIYFAIYIHTLAYMLAARRKLRAYNKSLENNFSAIKKRNILWLNYCLNFTIFALLILFVILVTLYFTSSFRMRYNLVPVVISVLGCIMASRVIIQPVIVPYEKPKNRLRLPEPGKLVKYKEKLLLAMENEKLYRIPDLSLGDLSAQLDISRNYISYVINNHLDTTFYEFINKYRLNEVKSVLKRKPGKPGSLQLIASSAGFNSKTTFNVMFKKDTGMTPSQYRKRIWSVAEKPKEVHVSYTPAVSLPHKQKTTFG